MIPIAPTAEVLTPVIWLGHAHGNNPVPAGSGVVTRLGGKEYVATAFHVLEECGKSPLVRFFEDWVPLPWKILAVDNDSDIAILSTEYELVGPNLPVNYGVTEGMVHGQIGYALGFPGVLDPISGGVSHVAEANGRPLPFSTLVTLYLHFSKGTVYSPSYINAGFSGGAIAFPVGNPVKWTIAGIITHFPNVPRPVYRSGVETGDYVMQHTGLVGFTPFERYSQHVLVMV